MIWSSGLSDARGNASISVSTSSRCFWRRSSAATVRSSHRSFQRLSPSDEAVRGLSASSHSHSRSKIACSRRPAASDGDCALSVTASAASATGRIQSAWRSMGNRVRMRNSGYHTRRPHELRRLHPHRLRGHRHPVPDGGQHPSKPDVWRLRIHGEHLRRRGRGAVLSAVLHQLERLQAEHAHPSPDSNHHVRDGHHAQRGRLRARAARPALGDHWRHPAFRDHADHGLSTDEAVRIPGGARGGHRARRRDAERRRLERDYLSIGGKRAVVGDDYGGLDTHVAVSEPARREILRRSVRAGGRGADDVRDPEDDRRPDYRGAHRQPAVLPADALARSRAADRLDGGDLRHSHHHHVAFTRQAAVGGVRADCRRDPPQQRGIPARLLECAAGGHGRGRCPDGGHRGRIAECGHGVGPGDQRPAQLGRRAGGGALRPLDEHLGFGARVVVAPASRGRAAGRRAPAR